MINTCYIVGLFSFVLSTSATSGSVSGWALDFWSWILDWDLGRLLDFSGVDLFPDITNVNNDKNYTY